MHGCEVTPNEFVADLLCLDPCSAVELHSHQEVGETWKGNLARDVAWEDSYVGSLGLEEVSGHYSSPACHNHLPQEAVLLPLQYASTSSPLCGKVF